MPTAGRLAAALALAALGAYLAYLTAPRFQEGQMPGYWYPLCVLAGVWAGWVVVGKRTGRGYGSAIGNGLTGVAALIFWVMFIMCFLFMIDKSMRRSYDGPVEALVNVFELILTQGAALYSLEIIVTAVIGGAAAGLWTEFFAKRLP